MGRSFWISHDQALAADLSEGIPLVTARVLGPDAADEEVVLAPALAAEPGLTSLRVLWVRAPGDSSRMAEPMRTTEASIRRLIPQQGLTVDFTEVLVPETLRDLAIPTPPPDWQQFVVEPRDRPHPTAPDSYYDLTTAPSQGLHAALIIGGALGGNNDGSTTLRDARIDRPWVVHPFSRIVRGADRARRETTAVLWERLHTVSAADIRPHAFYAPEPPESDQFADEAVDWVRNLDGGALCFHPVEVDLRPRGQTFTEFLRTVLAFLRWAFSGMFGVARWRDSSWALRHGLARRLESEDYGATIDPDAARPGKLNLTDWGELEAKSAADARERIVEASRADGRVPDPVVWKALAALIPSIIDGSSAPSGWVPRTRFNRKYVLAPGAVLRSGPIVPDLGSYATALSDAPPLAEEVRHLRHVGEQELALALSLTEAGLARELTQFHSPTGRVAATAQGIIRRAREEEALERARIRDAIRGAAPSTGPGPPPLLSRLRASVLADLLRASVAAGHLASAMEPPLPSAVPGLRKMLREATWILLSVLTVGAVTIGLLARFHAEVDALFALMQLPYPTHWTELGGWVVAALLLVVLAVFLRLFRAHRAYDEIGRRRLEYVGARADAAVEAVAERNRLRNGERILGEWEGVLCSIGTHDAPPTFGRAEAPDDLPDALQVADPAIDDDDLRELVTGAAIGPGWFRDALTALLDDVYSADERDALWRDEGLPGGPLVRLGSTAVDGEFQREWWKTWHLRAADRVVAALASPSREVRLQPSGSAKNVVAASSFQREITRPLAPEYRPGSDYEHLFDGSEGGRRVSGSARVDSAAFRLSPALTAVDTVLVMRRLGRPGKPAARTDGGEPPAHKGRV